MSHEREVAKRDRNERCYKDRTKFWMFQSDVPKPIDTFLSVVIASGVYIK